MKHVVSFSGGKDSTAMLLRLLEEKYPVDDIVFFDTGWEFPHLIEHVHAVSNYIQKNYKKKIIILHPEISFDYILTEKPIKTKSGENMNGQGWPGPRLRWCTEIKVRTMRNCFNQKYGKGNYYMYVGFAADEVKRTGCGNACDGEAKHGIHRLYPLIFEWDMDENECLQFCYDRGFDWFGMYQYFNRISCYCCPLKRIGDFKKTRMYFPGLWRKMMEKDKKININRGFYGRATVHDLDRRFAQESSLYDYMQQTEQKAMMGK